MSFLELARRLRDSEADRCESTDPDEAPTVEAREQIGAALIRSPHYGELWVVLEPGPALELVAEEAGRPEPRPVILAEDVARLRAKSDKMISAALAVLAVFPSARLVQ